VTKSNGGTTVTAASVTTYSVTAINNGPFPANNAVIADTPSAGLSLASVSCLASGGAVCPASLSTTTFQAGVAIPTFPPNSTLVFSVNVNVSAVFGTSVTNSVSITAPAGIPDTVPGNNTARDVDGVVAATARVVSAASICPANTTEQFTNLYLNGNFANTAGVVGAATQAAANVLPPEDQVSIQTGARSYLGGSVTQAIFPGDGARGVPGVPTFLLTNGNSVGAGLLLASQLVSNLVPGTVYQFMFYASNTANSATVPILEPRITQGTTTSVLSLPFTVAREATLVPASDTWTLQQRTFTAVFTTATLALFDRAAAASGDVGALAQINLRTCLPNADVTVTKSNSASFVFSGSLTTYTVVVSNNGPGIAPGTVVRDPFTVGLNKSSVSCVASAGATCPAAPSILALEGAGLSIPQLNSLANVTLTVAATVTAAFPATVTNTVGLTSSSSYADTNLANNSAFDADPLRAVANLAITKTDGTTTVSAGSTVGYTITISNSGPNPADGALFGDPAVTGLSCTTVTCTSVIGPAACPAAAGTTVALVQGAGVAIPTLGANSSVTFVVNCTVTATGQ